MTYLLRSVLLSLIFTTIFCSMVNGQGTDPIQRAALGVLYDNLDGENWPAYHTWKESEDYCNWVGVDCNEAGDVVGISIFVNTKGTIPSEIKDLVKLESFVLANSGEITAIADEIGTLSNLRELQLLGQQLTSLPAGIGDLKQLTTLNISRNNFVEVPSVIGQLSGLVTLDLSFNTFTALPPQIENLSNLQNFTATHTNLESLPTEIGALKNLESLNLANSSLLKELPVEIGTLKNLRLLRLSQNTFAEVPLVLKPLCYQSTEVILNRNPSDWETFCDCDRSAGQYTVVPNDICVGELLEVQEVYGSFTQLLLSKQGTLEVYAFSSFAEVEAFLIAQETYGVFTLYGLNSDALDCSYSTNLAGDIIVHCPEGSCLDLGPPSTITIRQVPEVSFIETDNAICVGDAYHLIAQTELFQGNTNCRYSFQIKEKGASDFSFIPLIQELFLNGPTTINQDSFLFLPTEQFPAGEYELSVSMDCIDCDMEERIPLTILPRPDVLPTLTATSCKEQLNVQIQEDCQVALDVEDVLGISDGACYDLFQYRIQIEDDYPNNGGIVDGCGVHQYKLYRGDAYQCGGNILAEDKTAPQLTCPDWISGLENEQAFICADLPQLMLSQSFEYTTNNKGDTLAGSVPASLKEVLDITGYPEVFDNCGDVQITVADELVDTNDPLFHEVIKEEGCKENQVLIKRTFIATDECQNLVSEACHQYIRLDPASLDAVSCPEDVTIACDQEEAPLDENGNPHPDYTGYPRLQGALGSYDLKPSVCNIGVSYTDSDRIEACGSTYKIVRSWQILDWCTNAIDTCQQIIKITDDKKPLVSCPEVDYDHDGNSDILTYSTGPYDCTAAFEVPLPVVEDNCSDWEVLTEIFKASTEGALIATILPNQSRYITGLPLGCYLIRYTVTDACGNMTIDACPFLVEDQVAPIAICDDQLTVAIGDSLSRVYAEQIDEGSTDNCSPVRIEVRRQILAGTDYACLSHFDLNKDSIVFGDEIKESPQLGDPDGDGVAELLYYTPWSDYVEFTCCDGNENIRVEMRVWDDRNEDGIVGNEIEKTLCDGSLKLVADNSNVCWLDILVEDKLPAVCEPPLATTIDCDKLPYDFNPADTVQMNKLFGSPSGSDNCTNFTIEELAPNLDGITDCGYGTFIRRFTAIDGQGQADGDSCEQIVTIRERHQYTIRFPRDITVNCYDPQPGGVVVDERGCDLLATSVKEEFFSTSGEECYAIYRTHSVINWCEYDGVSDPIILSNSFFSTNVTGTSSVGYYQYVQTIKVIDRIPPTVSATSTGPICSFSSDLENECPTLVTLRFKVTESCTPNDLDITLNLDAFQDGVIDQNITALLGGAYPDYTITGDFPLGQHEVIGKVKDGCGNEVDFKVPFEVIDCKGPTPVCLNGLAVALMPVNPVEDIDGDGDLDKGAMTVWATDFIIYPSTDCNDPVTYSINRKGELPSPRLVSLPITCEDDHNLSVEIWAWDSKGNADLCKTYIQITDNEILCAPSGGGSIAGMIANEAVAPLSDVNVSLNGNSITNIVTQVDGQYAFNALDGGFDYSVTPYLDAHPMNGVSTFDLVLLTKHILGIQVLDNPYHLIAADVNNTKSLTVQDAIELRRLILNIDTKYANNTSWRFIPRAYKFPNPSNPWSSDFPEVLNFNELNGVKEKQDFVAIKIGDLDLSSRMNAFQAESRTTKGQFLFEVAERSLKAGESYSIDFRAKDLPLVQAFQMTLALNSEMLAIEDLDYGLAQALNFGTHQMEEGLITASWNWPTGRVSNDQQTAVLFSLKVTALQDILLSDVLRISNRLTPAEAYDRSGELLNLGIDFGEGQIETANFEVYQNVPNPFKLETKIGFYLPKGESVKFRIYDTQGRTLQASAGIFQQGYHQINLNRASLGSTGILFYTLTAGEHSVTKKMLLVD